MGTKQEDIEARQNRTSEGVGTILDMLKEDRKLLAEKQKKEEDLNREIWLFLGIPFFVILGLYVAYEYGKSREDEKSRKKENEPREKEREEG